jgi:hypothetical protein
VAKHMPSVIVAPFVHLLGQLKLEDNSLHWANEQNLGILSTRGCTTLRHCVKEPIQTLPRDCHQALKCRPNFRVIGN